MPTEIMPIPKNIENRVILLKTEVPIFGNELGIKSNILMRSMTLNDRLIENVINSSLCLTGTKTPRQPKTVESPAIEERIKGHNISKMIDPPSLVKSMIYDPKLFLK